MKPLIGLVGYGDSDEEDDNVPVYPESRVGSSAPLPAGHHSVSASVHPAPIPHCPWTACYDDTSGFTYYWNQNTNAVTWEAPPEYLLALKVAQQQLNTSGSEVSAEEWQLYQQALAEKQNKDKVIAKAPITKPALNKATENKLPNKLAKAKGKRSFSDEEDVKIELITSYSNSDSESNDESESPKKAVAPQAPPPQPKPPLPKPVTKKQKTKPTPTEYGPSLPPNVNYTVPIGPELPHDLANEEPKAPEVREENGVSVETEKSSNDEEESQLLSKLKDKAKLLEKLGGEIPSDIQKTIGDDPKSGTSSPKTNTNPMDTNIDDLLEEIEKKELPKIVKSRMRIDDESNDSRDSAKSREVTPPLEPKPLFPSSKLIAENTETTLPSILPNIDKVEPSIVAEKKGPNIYIMNTDEPIEKVSRKKLRISNSVIPERRTTEVPAYTTKYNQFVEGFSGERKGLGFSQGSEEVSTPKETIKYGNGLMFTKGETLNEESKEEPLEELVALVEAKLKYLNQLQPCVVTPVQEMLIQLQTLSGARAAGALSLSYWSSWSRAAHAQLAAHEARAAPSGWTTTFLRSEGRYRYRREADGFEQWEYPAVDHTDMDICTTPPPPPIVEEKCAPPPPPPPPPPSRPLTPPPPSWSDPPPPGTDDPPPPPLPPPLPPATTDLPKTEIGDELMSFYNDIAELEKIKTVSVPVPSSTHSNSGSGSNPHTASNSPEPPIHKEKTRDKERVKEKDVKVSKKKSKVKISSSIGMKQKSVSTLVAKWQQVADEINSD